MFLLIGDQISFADLRSNLGLIAVTVGAMLVTRAIAIFGLGSGLEAIVSLSMSLILFERDLNIQLGELRDVSRSLRNLVTIGVLITLISGAMAAHWLSAFPWSMAFLYASLIVVTGPTVVNPLLKQVGADREITTLLEGEGVLVDPIGAILAVIALNIVLSGMALS